MVHSFLECKFLNTFELFVFMHNRLHHTHGSDLALNMQNFIGVLSERQIEKIFIYDSQFGIFMKHKIYQQISDINSSTYPTNNCLFGRPVSYLLSFLIKRFKIYDVNMNNLTY